KYRMMQGLTLKFTQCRFWHHIKVWRDKRDETIAFQKLLEDRRGFCCFHLDKFHGFRTPAAAQLSPTCGANIPDPVYFTKRSDQPACAIFLHQRNWRCIDRSAFATTMRQQLQRPDRQTEIEHKPQHKRTNI